MKRLDGDLIMAALVDLTGRVFGRLTVISRVHGAPRVRWLCQCECGATKEVQSNHLKNGKTLSCGCWLKESASVRRKIHGMSKAPNELERSTYQAWLNMRRRCNDANRPDYDRYGGKGVTVCNQWQDFGSFLADMGVKPGPKYSIDRIDYARGYEPGNCRWADPLTQGRNKSDVIVVEYRGERKPLSEWCADLGVSRRMVYERIRAGWDVARSLEQPSRFAVTA